MDDAEYKKRIAEELEKIAEGITKSVEENNKLKEEVRKLKEQLRKLKEKDIRKRKKCVICGEPSNRIELPMGTEIFSFCSGKCMDIYICQNPKGENLEVSGTMVYVK